MDRAGRWDLDRIFCRVLICGNGQIRKLGLIKNYVPRHNHTPGVQIETTVPLVLPGISKKNTAYRARGQFMWRGGIYIREAQAPKDAQAIIGRVHTVQAMVRRVEIDDS